MSFMIMSELDLPFMIIYFKYLPSQTDNLEIYDLKIVHTNSKFIKKINYYKILMRTHIYDFKIVYTINELYNFKICMMQ